MKPTKKHKVNLPNEKPALPCPALPCLVLPCLSRLGVEEKTIRGRKNAPPMMTNKPACLHQPESNLSLIWALSKHFEAYLKSERASQIARLTFWKKSNVGASTSVFRSNIKYTLPGYSNAFLQCISGHILSPTMPLACVLGSCLAGVIEPTTCSGLTPWKSTHKGNFRIILPGC